MAQAIVSSHRGLPLVLAGNALLRIAGTAGGALVGLYLAELVSQGRIVNAVVLGGTLGAMFFTAELAGALPLGALSDAFAPRAMMALGALLGAVATQLFGMSGAVTIFYLSRALEGLAAAATGPAVLAHLTDVTEGDEVLRGKVMSYYELSLLVGIALGYLTGSVLWEWLNTGAFTVMALVYVACAVLLTAGATGSRKHGGSEALAGLKKALADPYLLRLAPAWLCINAIVGLWLSQPLTILLSQQETRGQFLTGLLHGQPVGFGLIFLVYAIVFATGVTIWSFLMARFARKQVLNIALIGMFFACAGFYLLNHSQDWGAGARWALMAGIAVSIMVESGFTPAALAMLADVVGAQGGRGAAMGIYSVLLGIGQIVGSYMAGQLGNRFAVDGLIYGTAALALVAFVTVYFLPGQSIRERQKAYG